VGFQIGGGMIHFGEQWRFAMFVPVALRMDFTGLQLRALAKQSKDAALARRLLALAEIFDGGSRSDAARIGGVGLQTIHDWVLRFNAKGPEGIVILAGFTCFYCLRGESQAKRFQCLSIISPPSKKASTCSM
jgi:hypothetical protein